MNDTLRFPAEWETQSAILIAWPHADTDWADRLGDVEDTYIALVAAITRFQPVLIIVADDDLEAYADARLRSNRIDVDRVRFVTAQYDDTWLRDSGPITLKRADGGFRLLDFRFTGWGGKFDASLDDQLVGVLHAAGVFAPNAEVQSIPFALEGGGIETDGAGTLLTTWQCLHERHPDRERASLSTDLAGWLQQIVCCGWTTGIWKATTPTRTSTRWHASPRWTASSTRPAMTAAIRTSPNCRRWATSWPRCGPPTVRRTGCSRCRGHSR